jgi:hypothetical protein
MEILIDNKKDSVSKPQMELLEREKMEYTLLGTFYRTRGLKLFGYDPIKNLMFEVSVKTNNTLTLIPDKGKLNPVDFGTESCNVDTKFEYFEALNYKTAKLRLEKYKR